MKTRVEIHVTWATLLQLAFFALFIYATIQLWNLVMLLLLAALIAVALDPLFRKLQTAMPRWLAFMLLAFGIGGLLSIAAYCIFPPVIEQASHILERLPNYARAHLSLLPESNMLRASGMRILGNLHFERADLDAWVPRIMFAGQMAFGTLASILLVFVFAMYMLLEGETTFVWLILFFKTATRLKLRKTAEEIIPIISAYMVGQLVTSLLSGLFVFILLKALSVPAAMTLAVVAAVFDVLPVIGFLFAVVPTVVFAATVSPAVAVAVFFSYGTYHLFEAYMIAPWVYGRRLRLSGLSVLLAILAGTALGGIVGAILVMPLVASFPIFEAIWLRQFLGEEIVRGHALNADVSADV